MLHKVRSLGLQGIYGYEVSAECDLAGGLPNFDIVGLPDAAVKEARERVRSAIKNNGYSFPVGRITVNLAPANLRKSGTVYDLPIFVGILTASGQLDWCDPDCAFVGELSLSGTLRPVVGMLPMALAAKEAGIERLFVPADSAPEATLAEGLTVYPVENVEQLAEHLSGREQISPAPPWSQEGEDLPMPDFAEVRGQEQVKRMLEIAAAGGHNAAMIGPPGSGKSMLARRLPSILPPMTRREALEATQIHSVMGLTTKDHPLLPLPPPYDLRRRHGRGRQPLPPAGGNFPGPPRCPIPGRAAGVPQGRGGGPAPAHGRGEGDRRPFGGVRDVPQPLYAPVRHEPLQVRLVRAPVRALPLHPRPGQALSRQALRADAGPHRPLLRGPAAGI